MKHNLKFKRGFTLVEMLVVISIISFLAAIILGGYQYARRKAADVAVMKKMDQMEIAMTQYRIDNDYYPPTNPITHQGIDGTAYAFSFLSAGNYIDTSSFPSATLLYMHRCTGNVSCGAAGTFNTNTLFNALPCIDKTKLQAALLFYPLNTATEKYGLYGGYGVLCLYD